MKTKNENINSNNQGAIYSILFIIIIIVALFFVIKNMSNKNDEDIYSVVLSVGEHYTLESDVSNLEWTTSDFTIATVDSNGNVEAKTTGIVYIMAYDEGVLIYKYTLKIENNNDSTNINSTSINFENKNITLSVNEIYKLKLNVEPVDYDLSKLTWTSSNKNVVTVENGTVTAIGKGTSIITVSLPSGQSDTCNVTVTEKEANKIESIKFSVSNKSIYIGEKYQTEIIFTPSNINSKVNYISSNPKVATVSSTGLVTGISEGETVITASVDNISTKLNIKVSKNQTKTVTINFNSNGAEKISSTSETCTINNNKCKITLPTITRNGYQIVGWSTSSNSTTAEYKSGESITVYGDSTYYAITYKTVTATFNPNRASISKNSSSCKIYNKYANCTVQTPTISRTNYTSLGWGKSADTSSTVTNAGGNLVISSSETYYAITKINTDGIEVGCTGWMAAKNYYYSSASTSSTKTSISAGTSFTIEEVVGDYFKVTIPNVSGYKYILHKYAMINLSDYIPSMTFEITNASSSIYKSSGYSLPNVTGTKLYSTGKVYNVRLRKNEYMAPVLYATAKKLLTAQKTLSSQGYSIKVYDTYRPHSVSVKIYNSLTNLYNSNSTVKDNIDYSYGASGTRYSWGRAWFLASSVSTHNTGSAIDMTLVYKSSGKEVAMPTAMHELSTKAIKYYSPNVSRIPANYSKEMNDVAKVMDNAATSAGLTTLSSEWWHFQDKDAHNLIIGIETNGCDFQVSKVYSY